MAKGNSGDEGENRLTNDLYVDDSDNFKYYHYHDYYDGDRSTVYRHQVVALLNHDPHHVFDGDTVVHHDLGMPEPLDIPSNLEVLPRAEHSKINGGNAHPDEVLNAMRDWDRDERDESESEGEGENDEGELVELHP